MMLGKPPARRNGRPAPRNCLWLIPLAAGVLLPASVLAQDRPKDVRVAPVTEEHVEDLVPVTGDLRAQRRSLVAAQEAGLVLEAPVLEGAPVSQGDLLVRLDGERIEKERASLLSMRKATAAEREQRVAELEQSQRDVTSLESLSERGVTNPKELADARSAVKIAEAQLARTEADIEEIEARIALSDKRLSDLEIRAPFDGTITVRHIDVGEWLPVGGAALEMVSNGEVEAWFDVPEAHRGALVAAMKKSSANGGGPTFEVTVEAYERSFASSMPRLIPSVDRTARTFPLVLTIPDPEGLLAEGMSASAYVPTGRGGNHLLVPKDAVLRGTAGPYIYVARSMGPDGPPQAVPTPVRVLFPRGSSYAVAATGLAAGDLAIVEGNERLMPMDAVVPGGAPQGEKPGGTANEEGTER